MQEEGEKRHGEDTAFNYVRGTEWRGCKSAALV